MTRGFRSFHHRKTLFERLLTPEQPTYSLQGSFLNNLLVFKYDVTKNQVVLLRKNITWNLQFVPIYFNFKQSWREKFAYIHRVSDRLQILDACFNFWHSIPLLHLTVTIHVMFLTDVLTSRCISFASVTLTNNIIYFSVSRNLWFGFQFPNLK